MIQSMPHIIVFLGGVASVFSPCILPLIPIYFSILSKNSKNIFWGGGLLLLGFISSFFLMQILIYKFANLISYAFGELYLSKVLGVIMIIFSLHILGILKLVFLNQEKRKDLSERFEKNIYLFPFLLGFTLGLGWTPCTGPILFTVIGYATTAKNIFDALMIMGSYSLGFALPFLILSVAIVKYKRSTLFFNRYLDKIQKVSGVMVFLLGIAMFFDKLDLLYRI